jgi:hypothetical protein
MALLNDRLGASNRSRRSLSNKLRAKGPHSRDRRYADELEYLQLEYRAKIDDYKY